MKAVTAGIANTGNPRLQLRRKPHLPRLLSERRLPRQYPQP
jgi:hypothetical protein